MAKSFDFDSRFLLFVFLLFCVSFISLSFRFWWASYPASLLSLPITVSFMTVHWLYCMTLSSTYCWELMKSGGDVIVACHYCACCCWRSLNMNVPVTVQTAPQIFVIVVSSFFILLFLICSSGWGFLFFPSCFLPFADTLWDLKSPYRLISLSAISVPIRLTQIIAWTSFQYLYRCYFKSNILLGICRTLSIGEGSSFRPFQIWGSPVTRPVFFSIFSLSFAGFFHPKSACTRSFFSGAFCLYN